jgi:hypothetical protein
VENVAVYPFEWLDDLITVTGIHTFIDIGHFLERGEEFATAFNKYAFTTDILQIQLRPSTTTGHYYPQAV